MHELKHTFREQVSTRSPKYKGALQLVFLVFILSLAGCSSQPESSLPLNPPDSFADPGEQQAPDQWWTTFNDPQLDTLVQNALDSNFTLITAWYRLRAAEAVVNRETSYLWPDVEAFVQAAMSRPKPDFAGGENVRLGIRSSYEVDLWGRISSQVEAEKHRAQASHFDYQAAAISLSAEITRTWFQLMAAWRQLQLSEVQIENNQKILKVIRARFGSGQGRAVDILRQQQLVQSSRQQKIQAESNIELLEHQLAVLTGKPPQHQIAYQPDTLPDISPLPETGLPLELVERRPDVQRDFHFLKAADQELASAISAQYPRLTLDASVAARSNEVDNVFENWAYTLGTNIMAPIFYGGRLSAEVDRTEAVKQQRLYEYGQSVLVAFREVEDALIREKKQLEQLEVLEEQVELATKSYNQLQNQYFHGMSDYLDVLTALDQQQQLQRNFITARQTLLENRIELYRALAGGFELPERENQDNEENS